MLKVGDNFKFKFRRGEIVERTIVKIDAEEVMFTRNEKGDIKTVSTDYFAEMYMRYGVTK